VRRLGVGAALLLALVAGSAFTAASSVPRGSVGSHGSSVTANAVKPNECAGLDLADRVFGGSGAGGNDLVFGSGTVDGGSGDDCVVGSGGDDRLVGGSGNDVCIGNGGDDTFDASCETTYP
jgi:Ca2+-binding RTX toxin-like protein